MTRSMRRRPIRWKSIALILSGVLLALAPVALFSVPLLLSYDFPEWDGAAYFGLADSLARHGEVTPVLQDIYYSPGFVSIFALFQLATDMNAVWTYRVFHFLNLAALVTVSFLLFRRVSGRTLGALLATVFIYLSTVYLLDGFFIVHLFAAALFVVIVHLSWSASSNRMVWIAAIAGFGVFVRREFLVVAAVVAVVIVFEWIRDRKLVTQRIIAIALLAGATVMQFGLRPAGSQDVFVFCQTYEWNVAGREANYPADPSNCAYAFPRDFPDAESLSEAFFVNPNAFVGNVVWNVRDLGDAFAELVTQTVGRGRYAVAVVLVVMLIPLWLLRKRQATGETGDLDAAGTLWPAAMATAILVLVPAVTLIGNPHPKYLLAVPSVAVATAWGFGRRMAHGQRARDAGRRLGFDRVPELPVAALFLGAACYAFVAIATINAIWAGVSYSPPTNYRFVPIAHSIERTGLPPSPVAGTSAFSVTAILNHDSGREPWTPINFASFEEIINAPIAVIDGRLRHRVEAEEGIDDLVTVLEESYDFERLEHGANPDVILLIHR